MPSGILGQSAPAATTYTTVYTVPATKLATVNINVVNRGAVSGTVRIAIAATSTPSNAEFIEYDTEILNNAVLERTGFVVNAGELIVVYASNANFSFTVYGYEE